MPRPVALSFACPLFLLAALPGQITGIGPSGPIVRAETGLTFTEGPAQDASGNLYFSDVQGNAIYRIDPSGQRTTFLTPSSNANGIYFDRADRMLVCQHAGRVVQVDVATKAVTVLAGTYNTTAFNSPNDIVADVWGGFYFTDPTFGGNRQDKTAVYYHAANGAVTRVIDNLSQPNGVLLSPREDVLYVASQNPSAVMSYPVLGPGTLGAGTQWFPLAGNSVDGMTVDTAGNLYLARPNFSAIEVVTPAGTSLGRITFAERPSNCTFGGSDMRTLWVTARTSVYRAPMIARGHRPARLLASADSVAVTGGKVDLGIVTAPVHSGRTYVILAGTSGTSPGLILEGTRIPLVFDALSPTWFSLANTPLFAGFIGVLDGNGIATAAFQLPNVGSAYIGVKFDFAAGLVQPIDTATNAVRVELK
ncbi:MAG: SMP-30/gluconolactonase/LRE family protein [Planctomycetes bacterium]|nr:SMP-30/gluconolactonase/LRE family protein [Planctomycetota bacterium]